MQTRKALAAGVEKGRSCCGPRVPSAEEPILPVPCVLGSSGVHSRKNILKVVWPNLDGSPLIVCCGASRDCALASCAREQSKFAKKLKLSFFPVRPAHVYTQRTVISPGSHLWTSSRAFKNVSAGADISAGASATCVFERSKFTEI